MLYLTETELLENNLKGFESVFNKVSIYNINKNRALKEGRQYANTILFNINERAAIVDMGKILTFLVFADYMRNASTTQLMESGLLNEGFGDWIKDKTSKVTNAVKNFNLSDLWDKVKNWSTEQWNNVMSKIGGKFTKTWLFLKKLIDDKIKDVKEFLKTAAEMLASLGKTLKESLKALGVFGANTINDADLDKVDQYVAKNLKEDEELSFDMKKAINTIAFDEDEKTALECLVLYINNHLKNKNTKESNKFLFNESDILNESIALNEDNAFRNFFAKHRFLSMFLANQWKGRKIGWIPALIISITGAVLISIAGSIFVTGSGPAIVLGASIVWGTRNLIAILIKRLIQLRPGEKYWHDWRFFLSAALTAGVMTYSFMGAWKRFITAKINEEAAAQFLKAQEALEDFQSKHPNATMEEAAKWLDENPAFKKFIKISEGETVPGSVIQGADSTEIKDWIEYAKEKMYNVKSNSDWNDALASLDKKPPFEYNISLNVKAIGGQTSFVDSDIFKEFLKKHNLTSNDVEFINFNTGPSSALKYGKILSSNNPEFGKSEVIEELKAAIKEYGNGTGNATSIGSGIVKTKSITLAAFNTAFTPIANSIKAISACFDFLGRDDGYMVAVLGEDNSNRKPYILTDIKSNLSVDELQKELLGNPVIKQAMSDYKEAINTDSNKNAAKVALDAINNNKEINTRIQESISNINENDEATNAQIIANQIRQFKNSVSQKNHKFALWFGLYITKDDFNKKLVDHKPEEIEDWIDDNKSKKIPFLLMDLNTLLCYDCSTKETNHRSVAYSFKGLQKNLVLRPLLNKDKGTKEYVANMYRRLIKNCINISVNSHPGAIEKKNGQYVPVANYIWNNLNFGYFSADEVCKILNDQIDAYEYTSPEYADMVVDDNGARAFGSNADLANLLNFVEDYIWPKVSDSSEDVHKEIVRFANKDKKFKEMFFTNGTLDKNKFMNYEKFFRTSMVTFDKNINQSTIGKIKTKILNIARKKSLNFEEELEYNDKWKEVAAMAHIIWKYKYAKPNNDRVKDDNNPPSPPSDNHDNDTKRTYSDSSQRKQLQAPIKNKAIEGPKSTKLLTSGDSDKDSMSNNPKFKKYKEWYMLKIWPMVFPSERSKSGNINKKTIYNALPKEYKQFDKEKLKNALTNDITIYFICYAVKTGQPARLQKWWSETRLSNIYAKFGKDLRSELPKPTDKNKIDPVQLTLRLLFEYYKAIFENVNIKSKKQVNARIEESYK